MTEVQPPSCVDVAPCGPCAVGGFADAFFRLQFCFIQLVGQKVAWGAPPGAARGATPLHRHPLSPGARQQRLASVMDCEPSNAGNERQINGNINFA